MQSAMVRLRSCTRILNQEAIPRNVVHVHLRQVVKQQDIDDLLVMMLFDLPNTAGRHLFNRLWP